MLSESEAESTRLGLKLNKRSLVHVAAEVVRRDSMPMMSKTGIMKLPLEFNESDVSTSRLQTLVLQVHNLTRGDNRSARVRLQAYLVRLGAFPESPLCGCTTHAIAFKRLQSNCLVWAGVAQVSQSCARLTATCEPFRCATMLLAKQTSSWTFRRSIS